MKHELPTVNWTGALSHAVTLANDGDVIVCRSENMVQLAKRAISRLRPDLEISFEVSDNPEGQEETP